MHGCSRYASLCRSVLCRFSWLSVRCLVQAAEASIAPVRLGVAKPLGASSVASEYQQAPPYSYTASYSRRWVKKILHELFVFCFTVVLIVRVVCYELLLLHLLSACLFQFLRAGFCYERATAFPVLQSQNLFCYLIYFQFQHCSLELLYVLYGAQTILHWLTI